MNQGSIPFRVVVTYCVSQCRTIAKIFLRVSRWERGGGGRGWRRRVVRGIGTGYFIRWCDLNHTEGCVCQTLKWQMLMQINPEHSPCRLLVSGSISWRDSRLNRNISRRIPSLGWCYTTTASCNWSIFQRLGEWTTSSAWMNYRTSVGFVKANIV